MERRTSSSSEDSLAGRLVPCRAFMASSDTSWPVRSEIDRPSCVLTSSAGRPVRLKPPTRRTFSLLHEISLAVKGGGHARMRFLFSRLGRRSGSRFRDHRGVLSNLFHQIKKVAVSIRPVAVSSLIEFVDMADSRMNALNRGLAEVEKRCFRSRPLLQRQNQTFPRTL